VAALVLLGTGFTATAYFLQESTIVRSTTVAGVDVGGLRTDQALTKIRTQWEAYKQQAMVFRVGSKSLEISMTGNPTSAEDEFVIDLVKLDDEASATAAFTFGHEGDWWYQARLRLSGFLGRRHEVAKITFADSVLLDILEDQGKSEERAAVDAHVGFAEEVPIVVPSEAGTTYAYDTAVIQAFRLAKNLRPVDVLVAQKTVQPTVVTADSLEEVTTAETVKAFLDQTFPFRLTYNDQTWDISRDKGKTLLGFTSATNPSLSFDRALAISYLDTLRKDIDQEPVEPVLTLENGKVTKFSAGEVGREVNAEATIAAMRTAAVAKKKTSTVAVTLAQPQTATGDTNTLGITELIAEGTTDFKGSPTNRRYNLSLGAKRVNGVLVQPGETFSLIKALGKIDGKNGWKPELVIKGSQIIPEFGGGLCQVATTLFRAVLNAGLPITERTNHSLRISYYEPPIGLDATIYEPRPDLKFRNDYATPILFQTEVRGTKLIFRVYGTKDGRSVSLPTPKVFNQTKIPATKYIEVTNLKPGEQKCQKPGHPGADAIATYTVTKADGTKVVQTFKSHYRAIGVICQVGKAAESSPATNANTN